MQRNMGQHGTGLESKIKFVNPFVSCVFITVLTYHVYLFFSFSQDVILLLTDKKYNATWHKGLTIAVSVI